MVPQSIILFYAIFGVMWIIFELEPHFSYEGQYHQWDLGMGRPSNSAVYSRSLSQVKRHPPMAA